MIIKEFTPIFIDKVVKLQNQAFSDGWSAEMMASAFGGGRYFGYLAFDGEALVGFIACTLGMDVCDLEGIAVLPKYRGKGIAKSLILSAEEKVKRSTATAIMLEVRESNLNAQGLYLASGFTRLTVRKKYYHDGENAVIMKKEIVK